MPVACDAAEMQFNPVSPNSVFECLDALLALQLFFFVQFAAVAEAEKTDQI